MKKGYVLENLEITDIASDGKAVGRVDNQVVFIEGLVPGDVVEAQVTRKKKNYAEARLLSIKTFSPKRVKAECAHFGICGGCKWQHMSYADQLQFKQHHVSENLRKLSGISLTEVQTILPSDKVFAYRNKMEYTFSSSRWLTEEEVKSGQEFANRNAVGFHVPGRFDKVVDITSCLLQDDITNRIRNFIRKTAEDFHISFFDLRSQQGLLRNLIVRNTTTGEVMVLLSVTEMNDDIHKLLNEVKKEFPELTSLLYVVNSKKNDTISDLPVICFSGKDFITEKMKHLFYKIGPKSFYQTNSLQAEKLYGLAEEFAELQGDELVYDLYTGAGTIANYLAAKAGKVIGLEYVEDAVMDARANAELNHIHNTEFYAGDMSFLLTDAFFEEHGRPDVIITDPPRAGMHPDVVERLKNSGAHIIVYVSCNSATQARDLKILDEKYEVTRIQPVDMFPHTAHVENVCQLKIRK